MEADEARLVRERFRNETDKLYRFAIGNEPFECKDIERAWSDLKLQVKVTIFGGFLINSKLHYLGDFNKTVIDNIWEIFNKIVNDNIWGIFYK